MMCGSLERKALAGPEGPQQSRDWCSLTVCAGNLCGRLRMDQQIQSCRVVYRFEQQLPCDWSSGQTPFVGAKCFILFCS
jgi:hypothetical protein